MVEIAGHTIVYEDLYMNADELTRWLAAQQAETTRFLTEMGLALKKP
jgi:hypothetical protein